MSEERFKWIIKGHQDVGVLEGRGFYTFEEATLRYGNRIIARSQPLRDIELQTYYTQDFTKHLPDK